MGKKSIGGSFIAWFPGPGCGTAVEALPPGNPVICGGRASNRPIPGYAWDRGGKSGG